MKETVFNPDDHVCRVSDVLNSTVQLKDGEEVKTVDVLMDSPEGPIHEAFWKAMNRSLGAALADVADYMVYHNRSTASRGLKFDLKRTRNGEVSAVRVVVELIDPKTEERKDD